MKYTLKGSQKASLEFCSNANFEQNMHGQPTVGIHLYITLRFNKLKKSKNHTSIHYFPLIKLNLHFYS